MTVSYAKDKAALHAFLADALQTRPIEKVRKIGLGNTGNPNKFKLSEAKRAEIGVLIGEVTKVDQQEDPRYSDGTMFDRLLGSFDAISFDPEMPRYTSGVCILPEQFMSDIVAAMKATDPKTGEFLNDSLEFVYVTILNSAENPQKYSWSVIPVSEKAVSGTALERAMKMLAANGTAAPQLAAPAKGGKKAKTETAHEEDQAA